MRIELAPEQNVRFLRQCVEQFRVVNFTDQPTGRVYLQVVSGSPAWADREALPQALNNRDTHAGLLEVAPAAVGGEIPAPDGATYLRALSGAERNNTLGAWGFVKR
jgi:hypothetical protein